MWVNRRQLGRIAGMALAAMAFQACTVETDFSPASDGRLSAKPLANVTTKPRSERALGLERSRDAVLQLPAKAASERDRSRPDDSSLTMNWTGTRSRVAAGLSNERWLTRSGACRARRAASQPP